MGDVNRQQLALSCAMYEEKKNGVPRCSALVYMFCLEEGKCKFRKSYYAADDVIKMPCYDPKHDCSKRAADCHAFCLDYRRAAAELSMRNAAQKSVTAAYIADGIRKKQKETGMSDCMSLPNIPELVAILRSGSIDRVDAERCADALEELLKQLEEK